MKKFTALLICAIMIFSLIPLSVFADEDPTDADFYMTAADNPTLAYSIRSYSSGSNYYMFIPDGVDTSNAVIRYNCSVSKVSGATLTGGKIIASFEGELKIRVNGSFYITLMQGSLPSINVDIDPVYSVDTIHASKDNKIPAKAQVSGTEGGQFDIAPSPIEIKTRGNSTFDFIKKPYQIKFDKKTDMFGMGKAKKWILLANYVDGTMVRNKVVLDLAEKIGMPYTCQSVFVDLYIDGSYMGVYQLIEKVEIGDSRVPLETEYGLLAEMESLKRISAEDPNLTFYTSTTGKPFVYKEYNSDFESTDDPVEIENTKKAKEYFEGMVNQLEAEIYNGGDNWELVESLIDVDSFINFYFINEYCQNADATLASTYFYTDGPGDVIHCGPLWDYDRCFGTYDYPGSYEQSSDADFMKNITDSVDEYRVEWYKMLFRYPEFVDRANELYDEVIRDAFESSELIDAIDTYQAEILPSLRMNHVKFVVFHTISDLVEDIIGNASTDEYIEYTTDAVKNNIMLRYDFMNTAYGKYLPTLTYSAATGPDKWGRQLTGGSMTEGTTVTGLKMSVLDDNFTGSITYGYVNNGNYYEASEGEVLTSSTGRSRFHGIYMALTGNLANYFSIQYRVYRNNSWSAWTSDGAVAGGTSGSYHITRIQARLIQKKDVAYTTVNFDSMAGAPLESITAIAGNRIDLPETYKCGHIFDGWSYNGTADAFNSFDMPESDTTLYAKYTVNYTYMAGDSDGDGSIKISDLFLLKRICVGGVEGYEYIWENADTNLDNKLNISDILAIKRFLIGD